MMPTTSAATPAAIAVNGLSAIAKLTAKIATDIAVIAPAIAKNACGFFVAQSANFCTTGKTFCTIGNKPLPMLACKLSIWALSIRDVLAKPSDVLSKSPCASAVCL